VVDEVLDAAFAGELGFALGGPVLSLGGVKRGKQNRSERTPRHGGRYARPWAERERASRWRLSASNDT
jgi:hypothetical protein